MTASGEKRFGRPRGRGSGDKFLRIRRALRERVAGLEWRPGERLPTEHRLAAEYDASISTVRHAVDGLVEERLLVRRQGAGTYVCAHDQALMMDRYFHVVTREGRRLLPAHALLAFRERTASEVVRRALRLRRGDRVFEAESLVRMRGEPVMLDRIWIPAARFTGMTEVEFRDRKPTSFAYYQRRFGLTVVRARELVVAVKPDRRAREVLDVAAGWPLLMIRRTAFDAAGTPVEYRERLLDTRRHAYRGR